MRSFDITWRRYITVLPSGAIVERFIEEVYDDNEDYFDDS